MSNKSLRDPSYTVHVQHVTQYCYTIHVHNTQSPVLGARCTDCHAKSLQLTVHVIQFTLLCSVNSAFPLTPEHVPHIRTRDTLPIIIKLNLITLNYRFHIYYVVGINT